MFEVDVKNVMKKGSEGDQLGFGALIRVLDETRQLQQSPVD